MTAGGRLWIVAAEASGDRLGAELVISLRRRRPGLVVEGLAGPAMRSVGVRALARAEDATAIGLVEVVGSLPRLIALGLRLEAAIVASRPDVVVTIDSPELCLRLAARLRRRGVAVVHWVAPQVWAWRPDRVRHLGRAVDTVMCLLPFEPRWLDGHVRAVFVGHPAAAVVPDRSAPRPGTPTFALCPGSRASELARHWPVLRAVAQRLRGRFPRCGFVVPVAPTIDARALGGLDAELVASVSGVAQADAAVVASGTATLELAALGVPMVVIYQVHPLTWAIVRRWAQIAHVALPNVIAGAPLVPEILQDLDPDRIAGVAAGLVGSGVQVPASVLDTLQGARAIEHAADEVEAWLGEPAPPRAPEGLP